MNTPQKTLALLIDSDNIPLKHTKQIVQFCRGYGIFSIKMAYGDWNKPPLLAHRQTMNELGVKCTQQNRVGKNATDRALKKGVDQILAEGNVQVYVIVSGDGHFKTDCDRIRQTGAEVIGIGVKKNSSLKLQAACDKFHPLEEIVKKPSKEAIKAPAALEPKNLKILEMLLNAYQKTLQKHGRVHLSQFHEQFSQLDHQYDERFANKRPLTWLREFSHKFEVAEDQYVRMVI